MPRTEFHARENWFFSRGEQGEVYISVRRQDRHVSLVLASNEWASVVAHVSEPGESNETYNHAIGFHSGEDIRAQERERLRDRAEDLLWGVLKQETFKEIFEEDSDG